MAATPDFPRTGLSRRDALRLLAASSTTVAAGSMIISQPAHADSGSASCRYDFDQNPQVTVQMINQSGNRRDFLSVSVSGVGGECPCDPRTDPIQYAFWLTIPGVGSGGAGWITSNAVSVGSPTTLWGNQGGSVTVAVGIQVTCPAEVGTAVRCRFGSATFNVAGPNSNTTQGFTLGSENGNSTPPTGIPACASASPFLQSAPQLRSAGGLSVVAGAGSPPPYDPTADDGSTDLGAPEPTTTTTTDKPGKAPESKPSKSDSATTTTSLPDTSTTTSTSSTTTSTSTTTSSTVAPPEG